MDLTTNSAFENQEEFLEHYGKRGMKWGVWNAETRARYVGMPRRAGKALQQTVKSASSAVAKGAKAVKSKAGAKISETYSKRKQAKADKKVEKEEIAKQREELGMTRTKYEALRTQTLKSHDPRVVERGMHTLTDKELNAKIDRLKREETISRMAADQATRRHQENKARSEAIQANPVYKIGKDVLYKKIGISGGKKQNKAKDDTPKNKKSKDDKSKDNSSKSDTRITESPALLNKRYAKEYSGKGYKESVKKAVKSSAYNASINTDSARSAAAKGQRLLTDGTLKAEIISIETVGGSSRKALPPGRG